MRQYDITPLAKVLGLVAGLVENEFNEKGEEIPEFTVFPVMYAYILGGYKATIGTSLEDKRYYEVTYNVAKKEWYIDVYEKVHNIAIADDQLKAPLN